MKPKMVLEISAINLAECFLIKCFLKAVHCEVSGLFPSIET